MIKMKSGPNSMTLRGRFCHILSHPDFTVGNGIAPFQLLCSSQTITTGKEFHLAPKIVSHLVYRLYSLGGLPEKSAITAWASSR